MVASESCIYAFPCRNHHLLCIPWPACKSKPLKIWSRLWLGHVLLSFLSRRWFLRFWEEKTSPKTSVLRNVRRVDSRRAAAPKVGNRQKRQRFSKQAHHLPSRMQWRRLAAKTLREIPLGVRVVVVSKNCGAKKKWNCTACEHVVAFHPGRYRKKWRKVPPKKRQPTRSLSPSVIGPRSTELMAPFLRLPRMHGQRDREAKERLCGLVSTTLTSAFMKGRWASTWPHDKWISLVPSETWKVIMSLFQAAWVCHVVSKHMLIARVYVPFCSCVFVSPHRAACTWKPACWLSCQSRCDILRPKTSTIVFHSSTPKTPESLSTGWPQNVLQLDSGSLCSPDAVLFSFHVLHTFGVWLRCYPVQVPPASASVLARSPRSVCKVNSWVDVTAREDENNFCGLTIVLQLQDRQLPDQEHRGRLGRKDRAFVLKTSVLRDSAQILATLHDVTIELRPNFLN